MSAEPVRHGIVVGVDGSPPSDAAVAWAARDAALRRVPLTFVHALPIAAAPAWLDMGLPDDYWAWQKKRGQEIVAQARDLANKVTAGGEPLQFAAEVVSGHSVSTLIDYSHNADLLVVGCRGLGKWGRRLLGSVSASLVRHAHCPVAVIHDGPQHADDAPVVVGVDGSQASELATEIAFDEASRRGVELVVVHTWNDLDYDFPDVKWAELKPREDRVVSEQLAGWCERYPDVPVRRVVQRDRPAYQLVEQSDGAQLVVVGSRGRGGFPGMLLGSVSATVVESVQTPVIVARRSAETGS
ncbi:universal stress protein [Mycolicibacterium mageritense]|uniref:universal stress protein n=1 Tax=Mycolicibacterium mageritense TaxID=53462 RepID=UPI001E54E535|nr:universal stress protein [Mycolicibacterium mageritense]MCC9183414.1 universal stress protein [Mycolicibacterium mageritense]